MPARRSFPCCLSRMLLLSGTVLSAAACGPPGVPPDPRPVVGDPPTVAQDTLRIPGCDHVTVGDPALGERSQALVGTLFRMIGQRIEVPEYHDCQWLVNDTGNRYHERRVALYSLEQTPTRGLAAVVYSDSVTYGNGVRRIVPGVNCVYVDTEGPANTWKAAIVEGTGTGQVGVCPDDTPPVLPINLVVVASGEEIPPVARWDYAGPGNANRQVITLRCVAPDGGQHWCAVGAPGTVRHTVRAKNHTSQRILDIPGWYDEQQLAIPRNGSLTPSAIVATIFPDDDLSSLMDESSYQGKGWIDVAYVTMDQTLPKYLAKFNFMATPDSSSVNVVAICHGGANSECDMAGQSPSQQNASWQWWARITAPDASTVYRRVTVQPHGQRVPATARWRWLDNDENFWVRCIQGCCEVEDDF